MKKIIALTLIFALALAFGCSAPSEAPEAEEAKPLVSLYFKQKTITTATESATMSIVNNSQNNYSFDYSQHLEKLNGENWELVPLTNEAVAGALLWLGAGETQEITFDFASHYDFPLERGSYRVLKSFTSEAGDTVEAVCLFDIL